MIVIKRNFFYTSIFIVLLSMGNIGVEASTTEKRDKLISFELAKWEEKYSSEQSDYDRQDYKEEESQQTTAVSKTRVAPEEAVKNHTFQMGTEISHIKYEEPEFMEEEGNMRGVVGTYSYQGNLPVVPVNLDRCVVKTEGKLSWGQVDYKNSGTMDNIDDFMAEIRGIAGYSFSPCETVKITPYTGIGYRYLNDDSSGKITSTGALGYERESNFVYSPLGVELEKTLNKEWSVGTALEYDYFWFGVQKSHLSNVLASLNDIKNNQNSGYGLRGSLKVKRRSERFDVVFEPFIRYWNIDDSDSSIITYSGTVIGYGYEPKNNSTEYGIRLAVEF